MGPHTRQGRRRVGGDTRIVKENVSEKNNKTRQGRWYITHGGPEHREVEKGEKGGRSGSEQVGGENTSEA